MNMRKKFYRLQIKLARFRRIRLPRHIRRAKRASRHPYAVPFITISALFLITALLFLLARQTNTLPKVQDAMIVIISHDHIQEVVPTHEKTVAGLLKKYNIQLNQGDVVEPALTTTIDQDQFRINIYRAVPVLIIDGNNKTFTFSASTTPRAIANQAGYKIYPEDIVNSIPSQNFLSASAIGEQIVIDRAIPVNVDLYGTKVVLRTHATTVGGLIIEKGIKLVANDQIVPASDTPITSGQQIAFIRTGTKVETVTETIAMPVQTILDNSLAYGTSAVRQQGSSGQQIVTYQIQLKNNIETGRTAIQKLVTKPTVTQIVVVGTSLSGIKGDMALAGIPPSDYAYVDYIISHESGWCPTKWQGQIGYCPIYHGTPTASYIGYGLCQATPGYKMASAGEDWGTNPVTQLKWCSAYANSGKFNAYGGGWYGAYNYWLKHANW